MSNTLQKTVAQLTPGETFTLANGFTGTLQSRNGNALTFTGPDGNVITSNPPADTLVTVAAPAVPTPPVTDAQAATNVATAFPAATTVPPATNGHTPAVSVPTVPALDLERLAAAFEAFAKALRA